MAGEAVTDSAPDRNSPMMVLLVEDSLLLRLSTAAYLRGVGYGVIEANNAQDALDIVASGINVDLVLTDVRMPGAMDGDELAERLATEFPTLPVVLTTADDTFRLNSSANAVRRIIRKPYDLQGIERLIAECIATPNDE